MSWYDRYVLPRVVHWACSGEPTMRQRDKVVPLARGQVLEVGVGSGLNIRYYDESKVDRLWGLDPSAELLEKAAAPARAAGFDVEFLCSPAEDIGLADDSIDTVVITYTLCTIAEPVTALRQMARVLKPGGQLLFCEHGAAPDPGVRRWQDRLNNIWGKFGGGCNLNRDIPAIIEDGGFSITSLETMYLPGWRPGTFNYWGTAAERTT